MPEPIVLCYNLEGERGEGIRRLAESLGIRVRMVKPAQYLQTLAALSGLEPEADRPHEGPGFEDEMLVMGFFPQGLLGRFLDGIRQAGQSPVALKAMLTPPNSRWDSLALHKELLEEHAYFRRLEEERAAGKEAPRE